MISGAPINGADALVRGCFVCNHLIETTLYRERYREGVGTLFMTVSLTVAQAVSLRLLDSRSGHGGCVVDEAALGQVLSESFCFPCQSSHRLLHTHHHPSSGAGTVGQTVTDEASALCLNYTPNNISDGIIRGSSVGIATGYELDDRGGHSSSP
jgi:hypothetical protein